MASKVELCNLALVRIGAIGNITSLTEGTSVAEMCNIIYDYVVKSVISQGPWTSAVFRSQLAQLSTAPAFDFSYQYQLPTDPKCIKVLSINGEDEGVYDYRIEGDKLLTDLTDVDIVYIGNVDNPEEYDSYLVDAIVARLAAELAVKISGSSVKADAMWKLYYKILDEGLGNNNTQGSSDKIYPSRLINVRRM